MNEIILTLTNKKLVFLMCFLLTISKAVGQEQTVSGVVSDADGVPLPGVNVIVKGTNSGVQTNFDGAYEIDIGASDEVLIFSYIGFQTQEVSIDGQSRITISLEIDQESLDEVIVVGYGEQQKRTLTGSVAQVEGRK